ncbi:MAG: hydroxyacid dehydrogenase [Ruminococcaceae bacterium]|nr:hydroxyacid dehydrogenase [Oscillospiraceae bacterium]
MKSIFLSHAAPQIGYVYAKETIAKLKEIADISDTIYTKDDVLANPELFKDTEYVFSTWGMPKFTEEEIKANLPSLKAVFYGAGSVQGFARPFINSGVKVFSAWAANGVPVAEYTVAQIILANKGFYTLSRIMSSGDLSAKKIRAERAYCGNFGTTIGIIGAGMIGKMVIKMLKAYNLKVVVFDPFLPDEVAADLGVTKCSLEELFEQSTVISNHLADNMRTKRMINYEHFKRMKPNATFINTGRGAQVVEADLIRILTERPDVTAILDVTNPEPPVEGSEFYALDNCVLTPHIAGSSGDEVHRMSEYMVAEYEKLVAGQPCAYEVSLKMLETMA